jgi:hypothetical protein
VGLIHSTPELSSTHFLKNQGMDGKILEEFFYIYCLNNVSLKLFQNILSGNGNAGVV